MIHQNYQGVEGILVAREEELRLEKLKLKEKIRTWEKKIKDVKHSAGNPPRETEQEIQAQIANLERTHATTSQTKSEERLLLHEIEKLKKKKKTRAVYDKFVDEIDELQKCLDLARIELLEKDLALDELASGLRKVRLAGRAGCDCGDLIEKTLSIDEEKIPLLIGKGGVNIRTIEETHRVSIEINHVNANTRITGTPSAIQNAQEAIAILLDTISEDIPISNATMAVLLMDRSSLLQQFQTEHDVKAELNVPKSTCKLIGLSRAVGSVKNLIVSIPSFRNELAVDKALIPIIIGKGGSTIRGLASELRVQINIIRNDDTIEILGLKTDVLVATQRLNALMEDNREIEQSITVEKHIILGTLLANLRTVSKEFGVKIDVEGKKEDKIQSLKIKGPNVKVQASKVALQQIIEQYRSQSVSLEVTDEAISAILGKNGASIKAMREKYDGCHIDLEDKVVHVHSDDSEKRNVILAELNQIIGENFVETLPTNKEFAIMLKTQRAAEVRDALIKTLGLRLDIDKDNSFVKLKGSQNNVRQAMDMLRVLQSNYAVHTLTISEEDYPVLLSGEDASIVRVISDKFNVDISVNRKDFSLSIRGHPSNVESAVFSLKSFLDGDEQSGSQLIKMDEMLSAVFIGKAGANIKKMEENLGVKFDWLKSRGMLRIHGSPDKVRLAKVTVNDFFLAARVSAKMDLDIPLDKSRVVELTRRMNDFFDAELEISSDALTLTFRCCYRVFAEAKLWLQQQFSDKGIFSLPLLKKHSIALRDLADHGMGKFLKKHFQVSLGDNGIEISGDNEKIVHSKREIMRTLHSFFPTETAFIDLSRVCLREIVSGELLINLERLGCVLHFDCVEGFLWLVCPQENLASAQRTVEQTLIEWKVLNGIIPMEDFMIPLILGKEGTVINSLRKELECSISIDRTAHVMHVKAPSHETLEKALQFIHPMLDKMRTENWETKMNPAFAPLLIGKQGKNINKFRAETGVDIDVDVKAGVVKLHGPEEKLHEAKRRLMEFIHNEEKFQTLPRSFNLPAKIIPLIIGPKGATIKTLQETTGAKIDFDRDSKRCTLRGKYEDCEKAFNLINDVMESEGYKVIPRSRDGVDDKSTDESADEDLETNKPALSNNAGSTLLPKAQLSKSALKRLRKKERQLFISHEDSTTPTVDDSTGSALTSIPDCSHSEACALPAPSDTFNAPVLSVTATTLNRSVSSPPSSSPEKLVNFLLGKEPSAEFIGKKGDTATVFNSGSSRPAPAGVLPYAPSIGLTSYRSPFAQTNLKL